MNRPPPPLEPDTIAYVLVRLHDGGSLSVSGHVGDRRFALQLLDHARDAIAARPDSPIVIPPRDVDATAGVPLRAWGDMSPADRGDP
jgi:hypothetical protein